LTAVAPTPATPWQRQVDAAMQACIDHFGEGVQQVAYTQQGVTVLIDGIFEASTEAVDPDTGAAILSHQPVVSVRLAQLPAPPEAGDTCVIRGLSYRVIEPMLDGQGTATLRLHAV
jgi:hypothetical protein